jgi:hypothetical protein
MTGNMDNQVRRRKGIRLNPVVSNILIPFFRYG